MEKSLAILLLALSLAFLSSCSNSSNDVPEETINLNFQEENPLPIYLTITGYNQESSVVENSPQNHEIGYFFKPLKKGKINSIVIKLPATDANLTVRIWDLHNNAVIRTETVNVNAANTEITKAITPLELAKNKDYAITMIPENYFKMNRTDLGITNHPVTVGNIKIYGSYWNDSAMQNSSYITLIGWYNGLCSFNFLQTE